MLYGLVGVVYGQGGADTPPGAPADSVEPMPPGSMLPEFMLTVTDDVDELKQFTVF